MKKQVLLVIVHLIGASIFLLLPFLFSPDEGPKNFPRFFESNNTLRELIHYVLLLGFFYLNYYWLVPAFFFEKQYLVFSLAVIFFFLVVAFLPSMILPQTAPGPGSPFMEAGGGPEGQPGFADFFRRINHNLFLFFAIFFLSFLLRVGFRWRETEKLKLNAELSYLKAQINPHFLFNTLNSIYSLAIEKSDQTPNAIVKLSGMMRYITTEADKNFVSLEKELEYILDYIELQRLRFGQELLINYLQTGDAGGKKIAPLILIGFIENAFKYGVNLEENSEIKIAVTISGKELVFDCYNRKVLVKAGEISSAQAGLQNTRTRLALLYPGKHVLNIEETDLDYSVSLSLQLT